MTILYTEKYCAKLMRIFYEKQKPMQHHKHTGVFLELAKNKGAA